jgi:hypothetical protein
MYLILLVFGAFLTAAGVALAAAGISIHDHAFDASIFTAGIVAAVGGSLLIGLGLALRVLQRIEQALATRPMPRAAQFGEAVEPSAILDAPSEPAHVPLPAKPAKRLSVAPAAAKRAEDLPERSPALVQFGSAAVTEESEFLLAPKSLSSVGPSRVDEAVAEVDRARAARRRNGAASRVTPHLEMGARSSGTEKPRGPAFDSLWPKALRSTQATQAAPVRAMPTPAVEPEETVEPAPVEPSDFEQDQAPAEVTVLKSGVVDGMAYTLYSDGSIEAQLPQGMLRFGSITELRSHIEQSA